jgi:hypothetical protein
MAQIFHPSMNVVSKVSILGGVFGIAFLLWLLLVVTRSPYVTRAGVVQDQPVPFSHQHHVDTMGIDCRYCHASVEVSGSAGMPSTHTCMTCHSQLFTDSPMLELVRASYQSGTPISWQRVHDLPDFTYFDHSIHVAKGIGCVTCHGRVDQMPLTWRHATLHMEWCLECHRHPELYVRPRENVFQADWSPGDGDDAGGRRLVSEYAIEGPMSLTNCSVCHR